MQIFKYILVGFVTAAISLKFYIDKNYILGFISFIVSARAYHKAYKLINISTEKQ